MMRHTQPATIVSHPATHALSTHPLPKNSLSKPLLPKKHAAGKSQPDREINRAEINRADADLFSALSIPMPMWTTPTEQRQQAISFQHGQQEAADQSHSPDHPPPHNSLSQWPSSSYPASLLSSSIDGAMGFDTAVQKIAEPLMSETSALECVLLLPHLGEVQLKASQDEQQWHLQLSFMHPPSLDYVQKRQTTLAQRLSQRLGSPVILALSSREEETPQEQQASLEENELED